jgi:ribonuclease P protein component
VADTSFSKSSRLLTAADYKSVFSHAQFKVSCRYFLILAVGSASLKPRLGLVIAKKNISTAVQRNRIKRQIRESFRHSADFLNSLDLVVLARKDADKLDNSHLSDKLGVLLQDLSGKLKHGNKKQIGRH